MPDEPIPVALEIRRDGSLVEQLLRMSEAHGDLIVTLDGVSRTLLVRPLAEYPRMKGAAHAAGGAAWAAFWEAWYSSATPSPPTT